VNGQRNDNCIFVQSAEYGSPKDDGSMLAIGKTWMAKKEAVDLAGCDWFVVDADGHIVGRLATQIATVLMGKHKANYTPHVDTGDAVIVLNCDRVRFTGNAMEHARVPYLTTKMNKKSYARYTGFPGGYKVRSAVETFDTRPDQLLHEAVRRMLPKNKLGRQMLKKLRLFVGTNHPHQAQSPKPFPAHLMPDRKIKG
jgi:large subunit ribosomal protein L13